MQRTALDLALNRRDRPESIRGLLSANIAQAQEANSYGDLPLHLALKMCHPFETIELLLEAYPDASKIPNARFELPLAIALRWQFQPQQRTGVKADIQAANLGALVRIVLRANPGAAMIPDRVTGQLPLHTAVRMDLPCEIICALLEEPAAAGVPSPEGRLPLQIALRRGALAPQLSPNLMLGGDLPPHFSLRVLQNDAQFANSCRKYYAESWYRMLGQLLAAFPAAAAVESDGDLPLHVALRHATLQKDGKRWEALLFELLAAFPNAAAKRGSDDFLPLHLALQRDISLGVVSKLIICSPEASSTLCHGDLPLHIGIRNCFRAEVSRAVLRAYPDAVDMPDKNGQFAFHLAIGSYNMQIAAEIFKLAPSSTCAGVPGEVGVLHHLLERRHFKFALQVLTVTPHLAQEVFDGGLPLHTAIAMSAPDSLMSALLESHPFAVQTADKFGSRPLHLAIRYRASVPFIQLLIDMGSEDAHSLFKGKSLLQWAMHQHAADETIQLLIRANPSAALQTQSECTSALRESIRLCYGGSVVGMLLMIDPSGHDTVSDDDIVRSIQTSPSCHAIADLIDALVAHGRAQLLTHVRSILAITVCCSRFQSHAGLHRLLERGVSPLSEMKSMQALLKSMVRDEEDSDETFYDDEAESKVEIEFDSESGKEVWKPKLSFFDDVARSSSTEEGYLRVFCKTERYQEWGDPENPQHRTTWAVTSRRAVPQDVLQILSTWHQGAARWLKFIEMSLRQLTCLEAARKIAMFVVGHCQCSRCIPPRTRSVENPQPASTYAPPMLTGCAIGHDENLRQSISENASASGSVSEESNDFTAHIFPTEHHELINEPPAVIEPELAERITEELWATSVQRNISNAHLRRAHMQPLLLLTFDRFSARLESIILNSNVATRAVNRGAELTPAWARGAKILVEGVEEEDIDMPPDVGPLSFYHVVIREIDELDLLDALQEEPIRYKKLKPQGGRAELPGPDSLFAVSSIDCDEDAYSIVGTESHMFMVKGWLLRVKNTFLEVAPESASVSEKATANTW